jgi:hypothetical protein
MNKLAGALGNVVLAALIVAIIYGAYLIARTNALARDASEYTEKAIRAMADPWSADEFVKRAAPETLRQGGEKFMPELFAYYSGLGKLKSLDKPAGRVGSGAYPGTAIKGAWADYSAHAEFDTGPAEISLTLKRQGAGWQIANIQISAEAFNRMTQSPSRTSDERPLVNWK